MASTFAVSETYGDQGSPTTTDTTKLNFLSTNTASGSDTSANTLAAPITIPTGADVFSYERYTRGHWTGSFTTISNIRFWASSATPGTGVTIQAGNKGNQTYATAVATDSATAVSNVPTVQGSGLQPTYGTNFCFYIVMQMTVANTAGSGYVTAVTFTYGWDEV